ncbi:MAG: Proline utilization N-terminal domain, partial [Phycisphaerales bacterium]|nr:Proline utilization N-terminal domain [Phycisphaerales bacterium]
MDDATGISALDPRTAAVGRDLFARARAAGGGEPWLDRLLMHQGMRDDRVKAELFRFVDALPSLPTDAAVA